MEIIHSDIDQTTRIANVRPAARISPLASAGFDRPIQDTIENPLDYRTFSTAAAEIQGRPNGSAGLSADGGLVTSARAELILAVEGEHDARFLKRISAILHRDDSRIPDLGRLERLGVLVVIPIGGDNFRDWASRLQGFRMREFHLLDRETPLLTAEREQVVAQINCRPGCIARLTRKRALENYLHADAIREVRAIDVVITDSLDVADAVAKLVFESGASVAWSEIPSRARRRLRNQTKKWLNTAAAERMTPERIGVRDPHGDIRGWLSAIDSLIP